MDLQKIIKKYELRNKSRIESIKKEPNHKIKNILLTLHIETEEFITDLKSLYKNI